VLRKSPGFDIREGENDETTHSDILSIVLLNIAGCLAAQQQANERIRVSYFWNECCGKQN
jgi:hypothetical protein